MLLAIPFSSALITDNIAAWWNMTDSGSGNVSDMSGELVGFYNNGGTFGSDGDGNYISFDGTDDEGVTDRQFTLYNSNHYTTFAYEDTDNWSVVFWYDGGQTSNVDYANVILGTDQSSGLYANLGLDEGIPTYAHYNGGWVQAKATTDVADNALHFVAFVHYSDEKISIYVDNSEEASRVSSTISDAGKKYSIRRLMYGQSGSGAEWTQGKLYGAGVWNRSLKSSELTTLYNSGTPFNYPFSVTSDNVTVVVVDYFTNSTIQGVNVTVDGTTYENATGGYVTLGILENTTSLYNITVNGTGHFPRVFYDVNLSSGNFNAQLYGSQIELQAYLLNGSAVAANFTINGTSNETFYLPAGSFDVTANNTNYYGVVQEINVTALANETQNITGIYQLLLRIHFRDLANNTISNATVFNVTGDKTLNLSNITTGGYNLTVMNGYYNFTSLPAGYAQANEAFNNTGNNTPTTFDYYVYHYVFNSVTFYFYNEETFLIIDDRNVSFTMISDDFSGEYSTSTGSSLVSALAPVEYIVRYGALEYYNRSYVFTLINNTYTLLNLTLLNASNGDVVTFNVYDSLQLPLVGATLKVLKFVTADNSYKQISSQPTNFEGQAVESLQLNTEYYRFIVEYNGDTVLTTAPTYIFDTTVNLYANTLDSGFSPLFSLTGLYGAIDFDNDTLNATYTYTDGQNIATQGCFYLYRLVNGDRTDLNSSCVAGAAGSIILPVPNINGSYELRGYITKGGVDYFVTQEYVSIGAPDVFKDRESLLLSALIIITMFFLGFFAVEIGVILAAFAAMVLSFVGILAVTPSVTIPLFVLSLIIAFIISKNRTGGFL